MDTNEENQGRVIIHGHGAGGITRADVLQRARELALIDERATADPSPEYIAQAEAELTGQTIRPTLHDDGLSVGAITHDPSDETAFIENRSGVSHDSDEEEMVERLTLEGVDEAQHEQMIAARRAERRDQA